MAGEVAQANSQEQLAGLVSRRLIPLRLSGAIPQHTMLLHPLCPSSLVVLLILVFWACHDSVEICELCNSLFPLFLKKYNLGFVWLNSVLHMLWLGVYGVTGPIIGGCGEVRCKFNCGVSGRSSLLLPVQRQDVNCSSELRQKPGLALHTALELAHVRNRGGFIPG